MPIKLSLLAVLIHRVGAQLLVEPFIDINESSEDIKVPAGSRKGGKLKEGLSSPTICDPGVKQYSGYLPATRKEGLAVVQDEEETMYFFWLFESRRAPAEDPLVLWINGGPGCSSMLGMLAENGPCRVNDDGSTKLNPFSWNSRANVIWLDQPGSTGFSTGLLLNDNAELVAERMYIFMQNFYNELPQYASLDFYMFGESYGGHYIPCMAHYFLQQGQLGKFKVPVKGIGLVNGLTRPEEQYKWYPEMAYDGGKGHGGSLQRGAVTNLFVYLTMKAAVHPCVSQIHRCNQHGDVSTCANAYTFCNSAMMTPIRATGLNQYDMRIKCLPEFPLCYNFTNVERFLNSEDVQIQLGVNKFWKKCNYDVHDAFVSDWMKNYDTKIPDILAADVQVLVYAGDADYMCNWLGNKKWTLAMEWEHKSEFNAAEDVSYTLSGEVKGLLRSVKGFHFMQIFQAGHMVPTDQPEVALQILDDLVEGNLGAAQASMHQGKSTLSTTYDDGDGLRNTVLFFFAACAGALAGIALMGLLLTLHGRQQDVSAYEVLRS